MNRRLLWNNMKASPFLSLSIWLFMALCAFLMGLSGFLVSDLYQSMDTLMEQARTPDFLQMHSGELEEKQLADFFENQPGVQDWQVLNFLNLGGGDIVLNSTSLADSTQDNGISVQSDRFDFLLDMDSQIIEVKPGEIYVPAAYKKLYDLHLSDPVQIAGQPFILAGFVRDSQMNSMMSSSKRFLVSSEDYEALKEQGSEEYLIEALLKPGYSVSDLADAYALAGLPANGPAITKSLMKMMNALSDGLSALIVLLASVVMLLVSVLCLRLILLFELENDQSEIGMLKALGVPHSRIASIWQAKYLALSLLGSLTGLILAWMARSFMEAGIRELYGTSASPLSSLISMAVAIAGTLIVEALLMFSVRRTLGAIHKMNAVQAMRATGSRPFFTISRCALLIFVCAAGIFLMSVPWNLQSTISSPAFVRYMGVGQAQIRIDLRQSSDLSEKSKEISELLAHNSAVDTYVSLNTQTQNVLLPDGSKSLLQIERGDHSLFPVAYVEGEIPAEPKQIALSVLLAEDLGVKVGDTLTVQDSDHQEELRVCGIYSDITNGGKTAKAAALSDDQPQDWMWSIFYVTLADSQNIQNWIDQMHSELSNLGISAKIVDIPSFVQATYGPTIAQISLSAAVAGAASLLVIFAVVLLAARLLCAREKMEISLRKALGMRSLSIQKHYGLRLLLLCAAGTVLGLMAGCLLGQGIAGMLLGSLGASGFRFILDIPMIFAGIPVMALLVSVLAIVLGLREIRQISAMVCCTGRE